MSIKVIKNFNIKKELLTLSVLKYNMKYYENKDYKKFLDFHKQVDAQEYFLYHKYKLFSVDKKKKNILLSLNYLNHEFHNPLYPYIIYNNGLIYKKHKLLKSYGITDYKKLIFPVQISSDLSYCNVSKDKYQYLDLYLTSFESF